jgi:hypothetical protein
MTSIMSIAVWNTMRLHSSEFHLTDFLLGRVVLGDHALVAEPGSRRRTRCRPRPCWWPAVTRARGPSVTEDTLHCEEPSLLVDRRDDEDSGGLGYILVSEPGRPT